MKGDFEEHVEALAEVVARPHLRKSKYDIIQLTSCVKEKRQTFISEVEEGLQYVCSYNYLPYLNQLIYSCTIIN